MDTLETHPIIWITGSYKSKSSNVPVALRKKLETEGYGVTYLDGDQIVHRKSHAANGTDKRKIHKDSVAKVATGAQLQGDVVIVSFSLPAPSSVQVARSLSDKFFEVYISTPAGESQPDLVFELANCSVDYCVQDIFKHFKQEAYVKSYQAA